MSQDSDRGLDRPGRPGDAARRRQARPGRSRGRRSPTLNPATEEVLGVAADGGAADLDAAIAAARRAFDSNVGGWTTDPAFRARCLRQLRDALRRRTPTSCAR